MKGSIEEYYKISMVSWPVPSFYIVLYWRPFIHVFYTTLHGVEQRLYQGYYYKRIIFSLYDIWRTLNFLLFSVNLISFTVCSFALILKAPLVWIARWRCYTSIKQWTEFYGVWHNDELIDWLIAHVLFKSLNRIYYWSSE